MEDNLTTELHSDDKEMLRKRLALLQREYNRTIQRLQRAERSEAVRKHVRSRIAAENASQTEQSLIIPSNPSVLQEQTLVHINQSHSVVHQKNAAVRFSLPTDTPSPHSSLGELCCSDRLSDDQQTCSPSEQNGSQARKQDVRRHSAHRLRSRRSWLRWEQRERADSQRPEDGQGLVWQRERDMGGSPQVFISNVDCHLESLTLSRENATRHPSVGERCDPSETSLEEPMEKYFSIDGDLKDNQSMKKCVSLADLSENLIGSQQQSIQCSSRLSEGDLNLNSLSLESVHPTESSEQQDANCPLLSSDSVEAQCLSSCTLVEGLPFPVEYYVRTTRRMASSQSCVDLEAVILSQLNHSRKGRRRKGRVGETAVQCRQGSATTSLPQSTVLERTDNHVLSGVESCPDVNTSSLVKPHPGRRRRVGGGGGRKGRSQRLSKVTCSIQSTPCSEFVTPEPESTSVLTLHTETHVRVETKEVYPIFLVNRGKTCSNMVAATKCTSKRQQMEHLKGRNVLHRPFLERSHLSLRSVLSHVDVKDFHLPDEEFGRLKLEKLRSSVTTVTRTFGSDCCSYNTRWRASTARLTNGYKEMPTIEDAVGSPAMSDCLQPVGIQSDKGSAEFLADTSSNFSAASICKARHQDGKEDKDSFLQYEENGVDPTAELSPRVMQQCGLNKLKFVSNAISSCQIVGSLEGDGEGHPKLIEMDGGQEICTAGAGTATGQILPSPQVLNLSLTPTGTIQKHEISALPLWESPSFPSLGVTPAVPLHSSIPLQNCSPFTPPKAPGALAQPTTPSLVHGSQTHKALSRELSRGTTPSAICHSPMSAIQGQTQNGLSDDMRQVGDHMTNALSLTDSLPPSMCGSFNSQSKTSAHDLSAKCSDVSCALQPCRVDCPNNQPTVSNASSPLRGQITKPFQEEGISSSVYLASSLLPSFSQKGADGEFVKPAQIDQLSSLQAVTEPNSPHSERRTSLSLEKEHSCKNTLCTRSQKHSKLQALTRSAANSHDSQHLLSQGTQCRDLESYFTDSLWPSVAQVWSAHGQSTGGQPETEGAAPPAVPETPPTDFLQLTDKMKVTPGHCLTDVCSTYRGQELCVVTASEWVVSVWQQNSSQWDLLHMWTFTEHPVLSLVPVPDASGLVCVALGQLEIREARVLSFVGAEGHFAQLVLCAGEIQAVLGVSGARLVSCATSGCTQSTRVATLTKDGRLEDAVSLVSSDQSVQALAAVEGEEDALIGSTDSSHLVLWNMRTGHLLQRFVLGESLSSSLCLRGFSEGGLLFLLLQHKFVSQEDSILFSLIATNPVTAGHMLAQSLSCPAPCSGRFVDADVWGLTLAAAFQCGTLAVWDLRGSDPTARLTRGPEGGCSVVRWASPDCLLSGHLSGSVSLYQYNI